MAQNKSAQNVLRILAAVVGLTMSLLAPASAQNAMIDARMSGGGANGKCTFEVAVQGSAEVQIRGSQGRLVTLSGSPAQWRRLDCNQPLPTAPTNFKFNGVDGHGKQALSADPNSNNGVAVIRIDNNRKGVEGHTGNVTWNGGSSSNNWNNNSGNWNGNGNDSGYWQNGNSNWGGQFQSIRAKISGGGGDGKCTFEVTVNGIAEVQIRGDQARLQTVSGNPAQWRRLECNQPLPLNPGAFKFSGVDGHGQQTLVQSPTTNGGVAVIRIDNGNRGNNEGYTGDIKWQGGSGYVNSSSWGNGSAYQWSDSGGSNWNGESSAWNAVAGSAAAQACQSFISRRVSREHMDVTNVQVLPDTTKVSPVDGNIVRVHGQGQYSSNGGGNGGFEYLCAYDTQSQRVVDSNYRQ